MSAASKYPSVHFKPPLGLVQFKDGELMVVRNVKNAPIAEFIAYWSDGDGNRDRKMVAVTTDEPDYHGAHFYTFMTGTVVTSERYVPKVVDDAAPESTEGR